MIISHKYKFIFIKTRKTAGTSIELFLSKLCGENDVLTPIIKYGHTPQNYCGSFNPIPEITKYSNILIGSNNYPYRLFSSNPIKDCLRKRKFYNHIPAYMIKERISSDIWNDYYKFCFERNPWDKFLSHYYFFKGEIGKKFSFDDYISGKNFAWNYPLYTNPLNPNKIMVDYVGKYENLNEELSRIFARLSIPFDGSLSVRAHSQFRKDKRPYQEVLSRKEQDFIDKQFYQEIQMHGFRFN
ncbi:MAG: sulfotransferase family protein [Symploca sp. SIO3C6]|uniref:Sulfotransferase family protein n=1 Tax=Symploca sp. SIO1C4 TaxID=2607765 RepID=A0A6B3N7W7_9CYAN|nr:sulfotransferase family protein [Symploca sp. SIO3C6]NER26925.1 sulfotransferase family protein [Symploca sp. SIO1C4]NET07879.1 sulfotransferase family protein [Symploca sp. SIO2B6]